MTTAAKAPEKYQQQESIPASQGLISWPEHLISSTHSAVFLLWQKLEGRLSGCPVVLWLLLAFTYPAWRVESGFALLKSPSLPSIKSSGHTSMGPHLASEQRLWNGTASSVRFWVPREWTFCLSGDLSQSQCTIWILRVGTWAVFSPSVTLLHIWSLHLSPRLESIPSNDSCRNTHAQWRPLL